MIGTLEAELTAVADTFSGLTPGQWQRSTLLIPVDPDLPKWTVFELASGRAPSDDNRLPLIG